MLNKIFSEDNIIFRFLSRFCDYMWLGILTCIGCIPLVTIATSLSTLFYCCNKIAKKEDTHLTDTFLVAYRSNLKKGFFLSLIMLGVMLILVGDIIIMFFSEQVLGIAVKVPSIIMIMLLLFMIAIIATAVHICPLQASFENSVGTTLKNAFFLSVTNIPATILIIILDAIPIVVSIMIPSFIIFMVMFGLSVPCQISVYIYRRIFAKFGYIQEEDVEE